MNGPKNNGISASRLVWYAMTVAVSVIVLGGGAWIGSVSSEQSELRAEQRAMQEKQAGIGERLSAVETKLEAVSETTKETRADVREIRRLLEGRPR